MDEDDFFSSAPTDPLILVCKQELGPISVAELDDRIALLKAEIVRVEQHLAATQAHRSAADELFKRS